MGEVLAVDTESNGRDYRCDPEVRTTGVSIASSPSTGKYFPFQHEIGVNLGPVELAQVKERIESADVLIFHNRKHDVLALDQLGIHIKNKPAYCTMLMAHFVDENLPSKALDYLSRRYGGKPKARSDLMTRFIKNLGWGYVPVEVMRPYAINDAEITYQLWTKLHPAFQSEGFEGALWARECAFSDLVSRMECLGIAVDQELCERECANGHTRMEEIRQELGLNPSSRDDLEELLIHRMKLGVEGLTSTGMPSFDKEAMKKYEEILDGRNDPTARLVLEYRGWQKTVSSNYEAYLNLLGADGYLHPNFKLHGTRTTRLSCEDPNLQQIPRASSNRWNGNLKRAFVARPGFALYEADYSNLELRLAAIYSGEPNLIAPLVAGFKPFDSMAELLHGPLWTQEQRQEAKTFTYATLYGGGIQRIRDLFGLTWEEAKARRDAWFGSYPGLQTASQKAARLAERRGYVSLWTGRRRHLSPEEGHKAFNSLLQGGAAELVKSVMLALSEVIDWDSCRMLLQVHDSVVFEIALGAEDHWLPIITEVMQDVVAFHARFGKIPFPIEMKRWAS